MTAMGGREIRRAWPALLLVMGAMWVFGVGGASAAPTSLPANCQEVSGELPNLCPSTPTDVSDGRLAPELQVLSDGTRRYHFDAVLWNYGAAFELNGSNCDTSQCSTVTQRIWVGDGTPGGASRDETISGGKLIIEVGDGHGHYHYENASLYEILVPGQPSLATAKIGFCMFDTFRDPNGNIPTSYYPSSAGACERSGSTVPMGISRGWGDYYPRTIANQWIVVTDLRAGAYTLRSTVNPGGEFIEANYDDNVLEETRVIPGATAADTTAATTANTATTIQLAGTVEGPNVRVRHVGGTIHTSAGPTLTFQITTQPANGTLTVVNQTGDTTAQLTYTPNPGFSGTDTFAYTTTDDRDLTSNTATVTIAVGSAPASTAPPAITGAPVAGETLTATPGSWAGDGSLVFAYQWQRCDTAGANCTDIPGSTAETHVISADDIGLMLRLNVAASNSFGSALASSASTAIVTALPLVRDPTSQLVRQQVVGSSFADFLVGSILHELFRGFGGPDVIVGKGGSDLAYGGKGRDSLKLGNGADIGYGGRGRDTLRLGNGPDTGYGGRGADLLIGGNGRDTLYGGNGNDTLNIRDGKPDAGNCGKGRDIVIADAKDVIHKSCEIVKLPRKATA